MRSCDLSKQWQLKPDRSRDEWSTGEMKHRAVVVKQRRSESLSIGKWVGGREKGEERVCGSHNGNENCVGATECYPGARGPLADIQ